MIFAFDDQGMMVVEKQYRRGVDDFVYELPAGWINNGETKVETAVRELKEETGFTGKVLATYEAFPEPGFLSMRAHVVFLKIDHNQVQKKDLYWDEFIETKIMKIDQVKKMITSGKIKDMGFLSAFSIFLSKKSFEK